MTVWIINNQLGRRNLPAYVRGELELLKGGLESRQGERRDLSRWTCEVCDHTHGPDRLTCNNCYTDRPELLTMLAKVDRANELADKAGLGRTSTVKALKILESDIPPDQEQRLMSGASSINEVYKEIKLRCERRLGELLIEKKAAGEIKRGSSNVTGATHLDDLGIDRRTSSRSQKIARVRRSVSGLRSIYARLMASGGG